MKSNKILSTINSHNPKNIIFDMTGVLFHPSMKFVASEVGWSKFLLYGIKNRQNPFNIFHKILETLNTLYPSSANYTYRGKVLAEPIRLWQIGEKTCKQILSEVSKKVEESFDLGIFTSLLEKKMVEKALNVIFNPEKLVDKSLKPIKKGMKVFEKLVNTKENKKIFLLSNFDKETFDILKQRYAKFFSHFDGIVISGDVGLMKPDAKMYQHLIDTYDINPHESVFIDDQEDNLIAAEKFGIKGVHFTR